MSLTQFLTKLFLNSLAVFASAYVLPGVSVDSPLTVVMVAIFLGVVNTFVKPILSLLTLPLTIMTFGLFSLVINALLVLFVSWLVPGFVVAGFLWALLFSLILSLVNSFLNMIS